MTTTERINQHEPVDVAVIIGSTRPGRRGPRVGRWLMAQLAERDDLAVDLIDLEALDLPAALPPDDHPAAAELIHRVDRADAFIIVTPEYNHGYPASIKQALDVPYREWSAKPVAFVSYGGMSGGIRAVEQLRQVLAELRAVTIRDGVAFPGTKIDADGVADDPEAADAAKVMVDELLWWARALREARAGRAHRGPQPATGLPPTRNRDVDEIRSILDAMAEGFNARDVHRADQHFSADAVFIAPNGRRVEGHGALVRYHEARLAGPAHTWTTTYHVRKATFVDPRVAIVHTVQDVDTGDGTFRNHGTFVFVKRHSRWWITAAHNTNAEVNEDEPSTATALPV